MGGCQSTSETTTAPIKMRQPKNILPPKHVFKQIKQFSIPHSFTNNGKITDLIIKNQNVNYDQFRKSYQKLIMSTNHLYYDPEFPAILNSIGTQKFSKQIQWMRSQKLFGPQFQIFSDISVQSIIQGKLKNNYFISTLIGIKQKPNIIKRLFQTLQPNSYGIYAIWLCIDGAWKLLTLDDQFPAQSGNILFSTTKKQQIWVSLLQKAFARVFGSYMKIQRGLTAITISYLTGAPYEYFLKDLKAKPNINQMWNFIRKNFIKQYFLFGSDRKNSLQNQISYSYSILDIKEIIIKQNNNQNKIERLIKLANPYSNFQWKGRWSSSSKKWTPKIKQELNYNEQQQQDGIFWMNIENFAQKFGQVSACKYYEQYLYTFMKLKFNKQRIGFKGIYLSVNLKTKGFVTITQKDSRHFQLQQQYKYSVLRIIVLEINEARTFERYLGDIMDSTRDSTIQLDLQAGIYYIAIEIQWCNDLTRQMVLNFYGQHGVIFTQDKQLPQSMDLLLNQIILLHEHKTQKQRIHEYVNDQKIKRVTGSVAGYIYYHYKNQSQDFNFLQERVILKQRKYISVHNQKEKDQFLVRIYPGQEKIYKLRVQCQGNGYYSYSTKIQFFLIQEFPEQILRNLCDKKPTKVKKRQIDGKQLDLYVKTYNYSGGVALLYQNKLQRYLFSQLLTVQMQNLFLKNAKISAKNQIEIKLQPKTQKLLSFVIKQAGKSISLKTNMNYRINSFDYRF